MAKKEKLSKENITEKHENLNEWTLEEYKKLSKNFSFENFKKALEFTNKIGEIAENQMHHPDIFLTWGKVSIAIQTHETGGLTEKDFKLAQAIDQINQ